MKRNKFSIMIIALAMIFVASMTAFGCSQPSNSTPSGEVDVVFDGYLSSNTISVGIDETYSLNAINVKIKEWSSSNTSIATVSSEGVVTGKAEGVAFIYAVSEEGQTFSCIVSVVVPNTDVASIELSETEYYMGVGDVYTITADVIYQSVDLGETVEWNVSNPEICSIEKDGNKVYVSANGVGETLVAASLRGKVAQCKLIIREQKSNESDFAEIPTDMATAKMTKNYYEYGRLNSDAVVEGASSTIYQTAIYEKASEKYSIVAFATLSNGKKDINWTTENYFAYGFYLETVQVYDGDTGMQGADRIYYAYNGTDDSGKYGIEIENVPEGYFAVYSFVEYIDNGEIKKEISSEKIYLGEYEPEFVYSSNDFRAYMINRSWHGTDNGKVYIPGAFSGAETRVVDGTEAFERIKPKYEIEAPIMEVYDGSRSVYPSVMVKAQTVMSKEMLKEVLGDGITVLSFKVCYKTDSARKFTGYLGTTNLSVLDSTFPKTVTDMPYDNTKPPTHYGGVNSYEAAYEEYLMKASTTRAIESDTWYTIEYNVKDLIEDYDVFFAEKAEYPFFAFSMNSGVDNAVDTERDGKVLISDIEFSSVSFDNMFSEKDMYSFVWARSGEENENTWKYLSTSTTNSRRCNAVEAEDGQDIIDFTDASGVTKEVAYKFKYTYITYEQSGATEQHVYEEMKREQVTQGRYLLLSFENSRITKSLLEELLTLGYEKLSFSIIVDDNGRANTLRVKTIDFDYLRANPDKTLMSTDRYGLCVNDYAFKATNVTVNEARNWYTISYKIEDLIEFYDQIFGCPKLLLAQAWTDYTEGTSSQDQFPYYYITKVGFKKGVNFEGAEDTHPDIFD